MDGINGISGLYSFVMLTTLWYINNYNQSFIENDLLIILLISVLVFLYFNFRKQAVCFGGDVGSVGIAYILVFLVLKLILKTQDWKYIFLFLIYGIDTLCTILYRLYKKQNIFEAHKLHLFQLLVYKKGLSHLNVTIIYAILQITINFLIVILCCFNLYYSFLVIFLTAVYLYVKQVLLNDH